LEAPRLDQPGGRRVRGERDRPRSIEAPAMCLLLQPFDRSPAEAATSEVRVNVRAEFEGPVFSLVERRRCDQTAVTVEGEPRVTLKLDPSPPPRDLVGVDRVGFLEVGAVERV